MLAKVHCSRQYRMHDRKLPTIRVRQWLCRSRFYPSKITCNFSVYSYNNSTSSRLNWVSRLSADFYGRFTRTDRRCTCEHRWVRHRPTTCFFFSWCCEKGMRLFYTLIISSHRNGTQISQTHRTNTASRYGGRFIRFQTKSFTSTPQQHRKHFCSEQRTGNVRWKSVWEAVHFAAEQNGFEYKQSRSNGTGSQGE